MRGRMSWSWPALAAGLALCAGASAATGGTVDHVHVNGAGRNSTRTFSKSLTVDVALVGGYTRRSFDGDEGKWDGPAYHASLKPDLDGVTHMDWGVDFDLASRTSLEQFAKQFALDFGSWRVLQQEQRTIPHVVGNRQVGTISGLMILTQAPGDNAAAFDSAFSFRLCRDVIVAAHFSTLTPSTKSPNPFGTYIIDGGTDVQTWNRDHIRAALDGVALNGYLPAARLAATARGRTVGGTVADCIGHPMPGVVVKVGTKRTVTNGAGAYVARVTHAGKVLVSVSAGGGTVRRAVRVK